MKILYVITQGDAGGAQRYVLELAKAFHGEIATGTEKSSLGTEAEDNNIPVHYLYHLKRSINPLDDIPAFYDLVRLVRKTEPEIVHLNSSKAGFLGSFLKLFTKAKIVYTAHGFVFNEPHNLFVKKILVFLERFASRYRDFVITVSSKDQQSALNYGIINSKKLATIHNGIPPILFLNKTSARQYLGIPLDKIVIGTIANLYYTKGIDVLIEAAARMDKAHLQYLCFSIIGEGKELATCERLAATYGLSENFKFVGHRELASHYLSAFDLFVLPSRKEGFPFVLLEAMQAGLPIVATDVGGNSEALGDAGILVPPKQPESLAQTITNLIFGKAPSGGSEKLIELSQKAAERSAQFTEYKMVEATEKIYQYLLQKPNS